MFGSYWDQSLRIEGGRLSAESSEDGNLSKQHAKSSDGGNLIQTAAKATQIECRECHTDIDIERGKREVADQTLTAG